MPRLYTRPSVAVLSGESVDDVGDGYGVLATVAGESCSLLVASCVLAASVIIWEACAFAALAAVLVAGVTWCLSLAAAGRAAGTVFRSTAAPGSRASGVGCGLAEIDISALPKSPYQHHRLGGGPAGGGDGVTCAVCLEDLRGGEMVRSLPECRHLFHVGCIDAWLQMHVTCPLCRSDLSPRRRVTTAAPVGSQAGSLSPQ
ncbi:putative RING-H2 finger protein ATL69 [Miscanthus floridulus]|uniref:putative RING-H2 finger protein ATL69 n=1 Tax=Miscanthus floridulus TaxID=154761 RepID=UPI003459B754